MINTTSLILPENPSPVLVTLADVFARHLRERGLALPDTVTLAHDAALPAESFAIDDGVVIRAADDLGFVAGVGKYLRTPAWRGADAPEKPFRLIYFATHFHNWYHEAPLEDVERYIQDLALWGYNALAVWFDMHHFTGIDDPAAGAMIDRLKAMLAAANRIGMGAVLLVLANEGYAGSPEALRADWRDGQNGYFRQLYHYHVELCPSNPEGLALLLRWHEERLAAFADVDMQAVIIWPYDQGGCTCAECAPWGANGYLRVAEPLARLVKARFPRAKTVLSTWDFDLCIDGEWTGLRDAFRTPPDWADYLMAENRGNMVPEFVLAEGAPGNLPLVGFPEISMHQCFPWGGFGANPLPARSEYLWGAVSAKYAGGMPYSEGIFEDLNKAFHAQFYWHADRSALETAREYLTYEFGPAAAEPLLRAIILLEGTLPRHRDGADRFILDQPDGVDEAYALVHQAEALLPEAATTAWRWRLLALRAFLDYELLHHDFHITAAAETALEELERLYCVTNESAMGVSPPTKAARQRSGKW